MTQKEFAEFFSVPQSFISQVENGKDSMPAHWVNILAKKLNVSDLSEYQLSICNKEERDNFMSRLNQFFDATELPQGRIAIQMGLTQRILLNILKGVGKCDETFFIQLAMGFPQLNLNWLFTGNGSMLNSDKYADVERIAVLVDTIATIQTSIAEKTKTIQLLQDQINQLKNQLNKSQS